MAKSTFVTAPSFASSGSVTSINHVPRPPSPPVSSRYPGDSGLHTRPVLSQFTLSRPTRFSATAPSYFPSISFSLFFYFALIHTGRARAPTFSHTLSRKCIHRAKMKFCEPPYCIHVAFRVLSLLFVECRDMLRAHTMIVLNNINSVKLLIVLLHHIKR
jgi:hypothetical protein